MAETENAAAQDSSQEAGDDKSKTKKPVKKPAKLKAKIVTIDPLAFAETIKTLESSMKEAEDAVTLAVQNTAMKSDYTENNPE